MNGLFGLLGIGSGAIRANAEAIASAARNTANVNTEGYSREITPFSAETFGGGVRAGDPVRSSDYLLWLREQAAGGELAHARDRADALTQLEDRIGGPDSSLADAFAAFFGGINALGARPADDSLRRGAVDAAVGVTRRFHDVAAGIADAQAAANQNVSTLATETSRLSAELAKLNDPIALKTDPALQDRRDQVARDLTELVGGAARVDPDGKMRFVLDSGVVLVDGDRAATVRATTDRRLEVVDGEHKDDVTKSLRGGRLGAQLELRDETLVGQMDSIDRLAFEFAGSVNAIHRANAGLDGTSGRDLFAPIAQVKGAAATISVSAEIDEDPRRLASAAVGAGPGDTSGLVALSSLADQKIAGLQDRSFIDQSIHAFTDLGFLAKTAASSADVAEARSGALAKLRDAVSGVSTEEELTHLSELEKATQASAKFVGIVDDLMSSLIETL